MSKRITEFELKILSHIWKEGNFATINEILRDWDDLPAPGYTTVLKTLQIMRDKGTITFEKEGKAYRYSATQTYSEVSISETERIISRTHAGNHLTFIQGFIDSKNLSAEEIDSLMNLLDEKKRQS